MRLFRICLVLISLLTAASVTKADTINFTVTITQQVGLHLVPVGTVYTGFVHYDGSVDPNFTGVPPLVTSYGFDYPSTPASLTALRTLWIQRHEVGQPMFVAMEYLDFSTPGASFSLVGNSFGMIIPLSVNAFGYGFQDGEIGRVSYSYVTDPVAAVPEPASIALLGTGLLGALNIARRKRSRL